MFGLLTASRQTQEPDYRRFVQETGFEYTRDLDAVAGSADERDTYLVIRGRFDFDRLEQFARAHGGTCDAYCRVPATQPGRWVSFMLLQPDVIVLAVSVNTAAVTRLSSVEPGAPPPAGAQPIWIQVPSPVLQDTGRWPIPARLLAVALRPAHSVLFSIGPNQGGELELRMNADFGDEHLAESTRNQLEIETRMLKLELAREKEPANPANLTGLLVAGTFQLVNNEVVGIWPVRHELLENLQF